MLKKFIKRSFLIFAALFVAIVSTSCGNKDVVTSLKLSKDYQGKTFLTDGLAEVTVAYYNDGDTTGFNVNGDQLRIRYYAINTPESTGQIEKWGKTASLFTKSKLEKAEKIVLEGSQTPPVAEGTGGRYLAFVWYIPEGQTEFVNLNLEIVANGYSKNTCDMSHEYYDYFVKAEEKAQKEKLAIHGDSEDPNFDTTLEAMTVKDLVEKNEQLDQQYVSVNAYIKKMDKNYLTIADIIDGKEYTYTVYLGYASMPPYFVVGNRVRFVGRVNSYEGQWQLSGIQWKLGSTDEEYSILLNRGYFLEFKGNKTTGYSYDYITVTELNEKDDYIEIKGTTSNLKTDNITVTIKVPKGVVGLKVGSKISCIAFNEYNDIQTNVNVISADVKSASDIKVI